MKQVIAAVIIFVAAQAIAAPDKNAEVRGVFKKWTVINNKFISEAKKCKSGKDAAQALNRYTDEMTKFQPEFEAVEAKYPDIFKDTEPSTDDPKKDELRAKLLEIDTLLNDTVIDDFLVSYDAIMQIINDFVVKYETDPAFMEAGSVS